LSSAIDARSVALTADQGRIVVDGSITSHATAGGAITLSASSDVVVNGVLDARPAAGDMNGKIELRTDQGGIFIAPTATIEAFNPGVAQQSLADGGLLLRLPRANVSATGLSLQGDLRQLSGITVEGFQRYTNTSGVLGAADVAADPSNPMY